MKKKYLILLLILSSSISEAQLLKLGFRIEPVLLLTEKSNINSYSFSPYGLYASILFEPIDNVGLEIRPGFMIAEEYYGGFEIGYNIRWVIPSTKFYLVGGINSHSNTFTNSHNGGSGYTKRILFKSFGLGYQKDSKLGFDLMYYWTNDREYAYSNYIDSSGNFNSAAKYVNGVIKIGFSLAWDIL